METTREDLITTRVSPTTDVTSESEDPKVTDGYIRIDEIATAISNDLKELLYYTTDNSVVSYSKLLDYIESIGTAANDIRDIIKKELLKTK